MTILKMASTDPDEIPSALPGGANDFPYDRVYLVYIGSTDLANPDIQVKCHRNTTNPVSTQSGVDDQFIGDMITDWTNMSIPKHATTPFDLHVKSDAGIIVFKLGKGMRFMEDPNQTPATAVIKAAGAPENRLYRPRWIGGAPGSRQTVSVVIKDHTSAPQDFGLGLVVRDSKSGLDTPVFIDPKVENDGNGQPFIDAVEQAQDQSDVVTG